jgi:hypothetical protein
MKIVDKKTFVKLPENTIFSKYEPCIFGDICIKGETINDRDFYYVKLNNIEYSDSSEFINNCSLAEKGKDINIDLDTYTRDGMFDDKQLFAIYGDNDLIKIINKLKLCIGIK